MAALLVLAFSLHTLLLSDSLAQRLAGSADDYSSGRWDSVAIWLSRLADHPLGIGLGGVREALANGELVCVFPEGGITRTGQIQGFKPGILKMLQGTDVPVVPVYLDGLWGSIFSFQGGKFFWKMPQRWPYPISIYFGPPVPQRDDLHHVSQSL